MRTEKGGVSVDRPSTTPSLAGSGAAMTWSRPGINVTWARASATSAGSTPNATADSAANSVLSTLMAPVSGVVTAWVRQRNEVRPGHNLISVASLRPTTTVGIRVSAAKSLAPRIVGVDDGL